MPSSPSIPNPNPNPKSSSSSASASDKKSFFDADCYDYTCFQCGKNIPKSRTGLCKLDYEMFVQSERDGVEGAEVVLENAYQLQRALKQRADRERYHRNDRYRLASFLEESSLLRSSVRKVKNRLSHADQAYLDRKFPKIITREKPNSKPNTKPNSKPNPKPNANPNNDNNVARAQEPDDQAMPDNRVEELDDDVEIVDSESESDSDSESDELADWFRNAPVRVDRMLGLN